MHFRYEDQQKSIVSEMVSISSGYSEPLASLGGSLSRLDVVTSLAMAAVSAPTQFTRPRVRATQQGHSAQVRPLEKNKTQYLRLRLYDFDFDARSAL